MFYFVIRAFSGVPGACCLHKPGSVSMHLSLYGERLFPDSMEVS